MKKTIQRSPAELAKIINRYSRKKLTLNPELAEKKRIYYEQIKNIVEKDTKTENRSYVNYNSSFYQILYKHGYNDIISVLRERYKQTKKPIKIFDDGIGLGYFLKDIKQKLTAEGIPSKTAGITLKKRTNNRFFLENSKTIDEIYETSLEEFIPKEKYSMIFSLFGGSHYTHYSIRFEQIFKLANSLEKGGIFCLGTSFVKEKYPTVYNNPKMLELVLNNLRKKGFYVDYVHYKYATRNEPKDLILIKKI